MWSDKETLHDFLGYSGYVEVLADICTQSSLAPLTLGIFGPWGSGKTSLMTMLQRHLDAQTKGAGVKTLWFNAWRYEGRDEAQSALIHAIISKLEEDKSLGQDVRDTLTKLKSSANVLKLAKVITKTAITLVPDIEGFFSAFEKQNEKVADTIERFDRDFAAVLAHAKISHLVVFIDDLDRCSSAKVIETFETIKLFLNTPACTFVIGADAQKIEDAVGEVYGVADDKQRRRDFLEKIVQIPFVIPEQKIDDIVCYVGMLLLAGHVQEDSWNELVQARPAFFGGTDGIESAVAAWPGQNRALFAETAAVDAEIREIMPYVRSLFHALRGNPRQIKRFLNILALRRRLAKANSLEVHLALLIKLAVLEYAWNDFFKSVVDTVDPLTGSCELFEAISKAAESGAGETSGKLLSDALALPALVHYLNREPILKSTDDLRPYLFLAQTSLSKERPEPVASVDEQARRIARNIGSDDRIRARASARQAAALDPEMAALVVRLLAQDLAQATNLTVQTHIITGLSEICRRHQSQYAAAVKALEKLAAPIVQALQIAGNAIISDARSSGVPVASELIETFVPKGALASALAGKKKPPAKGNI